MSPEDFFTLAEMKDGLTAPARVNELVTEIQKENDCIVKNVDVANIIAATKKRDCLDLFIQLEGLTFINRWLKDAQDCGHDTGDSCLEESIIAFLRALEHLNVSNEKAVSSGILTTVENLIRHTSPKVRDRAKSLFESLKQEQESGTLSRDVETAICDDMDISPSRECSDEAIQKEMQVEPEKVVGPVSSPVTLEPSEENLSIKEESMETVIVDSDNLVASQQNVIEESSGNFPDKLGQVTISSSETLIKESFKNCTEDFNHKVSSFSNDKIVPSDEKSETEDAEDSDVNNIDNDAIEVVRQVAIEMEKEAVDGKEPSYSSSEKISEGEIGQIDNSPGSSIDGNKFQLGPEFCPEVQQKEGPVENLNNELCIQDLNSAQQEEPEEGENDFRKFDLNEKIIPEDIDLLGNAYATAGTKNLGFPNFDLNVAESGDGDLPKLDLNYTNAEDIAQLDSWSEKTFFHDLNHHQSPSPSSSSSSMQPFLRNIDLNDQPPFPSLNVSGARKPDDSTISLMGTKVEINRNGFVPYVIPNGRISEPGLGFNFGPSVGSLSGVQPSFSQPNFTFPGSNGVGPSRPRFDLNSGLAFDGGNGDSGSSLNEGFRANTQPSSSSGAVEGAKRKEPDGGWEYYQNNNKYWK